MEYLLYVLLFALAAALLYIWGLRRSRDQQKTMEAMLAGKCEKRIRKHLRQNGSVTAEDAARLADGASVRWFYSRKRLTVTQPDVFAAALLKRMEKTGQLMPAPDGSGYLIRK